jgi:glyoxylase-like metal-dependent hydrolase (beta-lactamase superfamily II)
MQSKHIARYPLVLAALAFAAAAGCGPDHDSSTNDADAVGVIEQAATSIGGKELLEKLTSFRVHATGARWLRGEQFAPEGNAEPVNTYDETITYDGVGDALRIDVSRHVKTFGSDVPQTFHEIVRGNLGIVSDGESIFGAPGGPIATDGTSAIRREQLLLYPHLLVRQLIEKPTRIRYDGTSASDGRTYHRLVVDSDVAPLVLLVDAWTGRLARLTTRGSDPLFRDVAVEARYDDWQQSSAGISYPRRVQLVVAGDVVLDETRDTAEFRVTPDAAALTFPEGSNPTYAPADALYGEATSHYHQAFAGIGIRLDGHQTNIDAKPLAPGVFFLTGGTHNSLAVEQSGGVVLVEAPLDGARSDAIAAWAKTQFGDKPISHVVATHFHIDHAGGVRQFASKQVKIVVSEGLTAAFQGVFDAPSTLVPDALSAAPVSAKFLTVPANGSLTLPDATHPIEVVPVENTHAAHLVVVRLPNDHLLFESDLLDPQLPLFFGAPMKRWAVELHDAMVTHGWSGDTLVGGHGGTATFAELTSLITP